MFLRLKLYVVFLLAKIAEKIADCVSFEEIIVCYLSFLLYIMIYNDIVVSILHHRMAMSFYLRLKISSFAPNSS